MRIIQSGDSFWTKLFHDPESMNKVDDKATFERPQDFDMKLEEVAKKIGMMDKIN